MQYELKSVDEDYATRYILLSNAKNIYAISKVLFDILSFYQANPDYNIVSENMNSLYGISDFSPAFVHKALSDVFDKIDNEENDREKFANKYVKGKIAIIQFGQLQKLYSALSFLFTKKVFSFTLLTSLILSIYFLYYNHLLSVTAIYHSSTVFLTIPKTILLYILFIIVILLHEIGHASASYSFNIPPKEIGFGFYFIFPVFYTDVTDIWVLKKQQRILVNIAGIYFQFLINTLLIVFFYCTPFKMLIQQLIIANLASITISLIPFFRYDGYWIFCDYFNIQNLQTKAIHFSITILSFSRKKIRPLFKNSSRMLICYSVFNISFWMYVYMTIVKFIYHSVTIATNFFQMAGHYISLKLIEENFADITSVCLIIFLFLLQLINTTKILYYGFKRIHNP